MQIAFGSDGYRGEIGHSFTKEAVARVVLGTAAALHGSGANAGTPLPVGYDTRFLSRQMAEFAARLLAAEGFKPQLTHRACPSPYLSFVVKHTGAPLGMQFTASHNAPLYNGIKLKGGYGGSLLPDAVAEIEQAANKVSADRYSSLPLILKGPAPATINLDAEYIKAICKAAQFKGDPEQALAVDYMHGSAAGIYRDVLLEAFDVTCQLRAARDPLFGGCKPEPQPERLAELSRRLSYDGNHALGLAFDGDGDRLAVIDERGSYLASHEIFCLLLEHLAQHLGKKGLIATSVSFSGLVQRVAEANGCIVYDVPVGFKNVSQAIVEMNAIMGGEESGGTGFGHYLPERDALLMALLLMHARKLAGVALHEMVADLYARFGRPYFLHQDLPLPPGVDSRQLKLRLHELANLTDVAGDAVDSLNHRDGMKLRTANGWVLVRASGTEPLARIYAEGNDESQARAYAQAVAGFLGLA